MPKQNQKMKMLYLLKILWENTDEEHHLTRVEIQKLLDKYEVSIGRKNVYYDVEELKYFGIDVIKEKEGNKNIYYSVDNIHSAIEHNKMIKFKYFQWTTEKKQRLRKNGDFYYISPYSLIWEDENYYLIGYDATEGKIKHFRVDKMLNIDITDECRQGKEIFEKIDIATYPKKIFGMYDGEEKNVVIEFTNNFAGVVIDRFGKDVCMIKIDDKHFRTTVRVAVSKQFLGWIVSLGEGVRIISPNEVVEDMKKEGERLCKVYGGK